MNDAIWKINRLRVMGAGEILYRVKQMTKSLCEKRGWRMTPVLEPTGDMGRAWLIELPEELDIALYRAAADKILAGRFNVFAMSEAELDFPPNWNRDPKTKIEVPLTFGKLINYRDELLVGDIKYLWEPNRHAELVTLAQAWHLTGEEKYATGCQVLLVSWLEQCPYPLGVNWTSSLEHSVRLTNWMIAWHLLVSSSIFSGEVGRTFRRRWLDSIYQHCHFISGHFSCYSSANNHFLGELMGLFLASTTWPKWPESTQWAMHAAKQFEMAALTQNAPDGVNREQAFWYQHEVTDMMLLCGLVGRANGIEFSETYWKRLETMLEFISSVMDVGGNMPIIGDADDAMIVRWVPDTAITLSAQSFLGVKTHLDRSNEFNVYRSLLATGAVLFKRSDFKAKAGQFDQKSRWLLGDAAEQIFDTLSVENNQLPIRRVFPDGGYYILGDGFEMPNEVRIVVDVGPLGYLSIAAHGHADALSFTLSASGQELLIDPGTFSFHTQKKWRDYFRGTSAHNTVRIDRLDQSVSGGNFLWVEHAKVFCELFETGAERDVLVGHHDGYRRLKDPVSHRRELLYEKAERVLTVTDILDCNQSHEAEVFWHFSEDCEVWIEEGVVVARKGVVILRMTISDANWQPELVIGQNDPPLGWVSRRFDVKVPSFSVVWHSVIYGCTSIETTIKLY